MMPTVDLLMPSPAWLHVKQLCTLYGPCNSLSSAQQAADENMANIDRPTTTCLSNLHMKSYTTLIQGVEPKCLQGLSMHAGQESRSRISPFCKLCTKVAATLADFDKRSEYL